MRGERRQRTGGGRIAVALAGVVLLAGCRSRADKELVAVARAVRDGGPQRELQRYFDTHPQCAPVLFTDHRTGLLKASRGSPYAAALREAQLIEPAGAGEDGQELFRPAPPAQRWFTRRADDVGKNWLLCYATRAVLPLTIAPDASLRYRFTLKNPAPWMQAAAMTRAFPAVATSLNGWAFEGLEAVSLENGHIKDLRVLQPTDDYGPLMDFAAQFNEPEHAFPTAAK